MANIARVLLLRTNESDPPYVRLWHETEVRSSMICPLNGRKRTSGEVDALSAFDPEMG